MALLVATSTGPLVDVTQFERKLAGAETNVAIGLARLGARVSWVSRVGNDSFGRFVTSAVGSEGVDCSHVEVDPARPTGIMLKSLTHGQGDPTTEYYRRGSAASMLSIADFNADLFSRARHLHATGIMPALTEASDLVLLDSLCHSCMAAGARLSGARILRFDEVDRPWLERLDAGRFEWRDARPARRSRTTGRSGG